MRTDHLINLLAQDTSTRSMPLSRVWGIAFVIATFAAAIAFFVLIGPRPDFLTAAHTVRFIFKFVTTLALVVLALVLLRALARPGADISRPAWLMLVVPAVLALAVAAEFATLPSTQWQSAWWGSNIVICLTFIPLIGVVPLAVFLLALRHGAPSRPRLAGGVAGLLAGGIAATFYAAHCTDDSPLFVATWYSVAISSLVLLGTLFGPKIARW